jgi:hypothetical protein
MVKIQDVSWTRAADGTYVVTWVEDGQPKVATFGTERAAIRMVNYLDTTGAQPSDQEMRAFDLALKDLERATFGFKVPVRQHKRQRRTFG